MSEQVFWPGLALVIFLAIVALNILDRERRSRMTSAQKREEDDEVRRLTNEW